VGIGVEHLTLFGKSKPALTRDAEKLSAALLSLDELGRARASETIGNIVNGIRSLGTMPPEVVEILWSILCTVARKAIMGADGEKMFLELRAGLAPEIHSMIAERSK
jgi:hypothetical protein